MSRKNNSPEQKAAWKANQRIGSRFIKVIRSDSYSPKPKELSRRDRWRIEVAERKRKFKAA